jgi:type III pantothenate kinase
MLPRIELLQPKHAIGRGTVTAMQSGILFGYMGLIEKIVHEITLELEAVPVVVATGGYANMFAEIVPAIQISNPDLSLIGLRLLHEMNTIER